MPWWSGCGRVGGCSTLARGRAAGWGCWTRRSVPPTFSVSRELVQGIIAGGDAALRLSAEGAEDSRTQGAADLAAAGFQSVAGTGCAGRHRRERPHALCAGCDGICAAAGDCLTIGVSCVPGSAVERAADIAITPATGAEVLTGSTRLKAGTATKLVLNMLSTALMIRLGHVYGNLMTNVAPTNAKLVDRAERIIAAATGVDPARAAELLREAGTVKTAIVMQRRTAGKAEAETLLRAHGGNLRQALEQP